MKVKTEGCSDHAEYSKRVRARIWIAIALASFACCGAPAQTIGDNFYSLSMLSNYPAMRAAPLPFLPNTNYSVVDLGVIDGAQSWLFDDSSADLTPPLDDGGLGLDSTSFRGPEFPWDCCSCTPYLAISATATGSNFVLLTCLRVLEGQAVTIYGAGDLSVPLGSWGVLTNLAAGDGFVTALIAMNPSNQFFRAAAAAYQATNYVLNTNFTFVGLTSEDRGEAVPDTMGTVAGNSVPYFCETLNGPTAAFYDVTGRVVVAATATNLLTGVDGRAVWDAHSGRLVLSSIFGTTLLLSVSRSANVTNFDSTNWFVFPLDLGGPGIIDFDTAAYDDNGCYFSIARFTNGATTYAGNCIVALKKGDLYQGNIVVTNRFDFYLTNSSGKGSIIQPVINLGPVGPSDRAWFVTKSAPEFGTSYKGGAIRYTSLTWSNATATLDPSGWHTITNDIYGDYFDLDVFGVLAPEATSLGGSYLDLNRMGSRLATPTIRSAHLWACQVVGLSGANGTFTNAVFLEDQSYTNVDRSGIQWIKLSVDAPGTLSYVTHGRIYDHSAGTNVLWSHTASIGLNCAGDAIIAFSACGRTNYVSAYYCWKLAGGTQFSAAVLIIAGTSKAGSVSGQWGDYSATSVGPDGGSFWTVQEFARPIPGGDPNTDPNWGTVIARIVPRPRPQ